MDIHTAIGIAEDVAAEKPIAQYTLELIESKANAGR